MDEMEAADIRPGEPRSGTGGPSPAHVSAAWWCAIVEPGDAHAHALREVLGEEAARAWAEAGAPGALPAVLGVDPRRWASWESAWERWHPRVSGVDPLADLAQLDALGGHLSVPGDPDWPESLDVLGHQVPHALWVLGSLSTPPRVAVVGARAATHYGESVAGDLALELAERGVDIVSGGAFGIDVAAHRGALAVPGGRTTSVMAGGVGRPYPLAHEAILAEVTQRGAVVSEVPPSWRPAKWRFLGRNRVIAALADVTVVVEASQRSGALATARRAMDLGRGVGAVPGPVTSGASGGCHEMVRAGATLVRGSADVVEMLTEIGAGPLPDVFGAPVDEDRGTDALPGDQRRVWEALPARSGAATDRLVRASGLSEREVLTALAHLQIAGLVGVDAGGWVRLHRDTPVGT